MFRGIRYSQCFQHLFIRLGHCVVQERKREINGRPEQAPHFYNLVANQVVVELKAVIELADVHIAQARNYVVAYDFDYGLLINFAAEFLENKRLYNKKPNPVNP